MPGKLPKHVGNDNASDTKLSLAVDAIKRHLSVHGVTALVRPDPRDQITPAYPTGFKTASCCSKIMQFVWRMAPMIAFSVKRS
jgi:hypothetical protein